MDKKYIGFGCLGAVVLVVLVVFFWVKGAYNGMVQARENGKEAFSQIDVVLKRNFQELNSLDNILGREEELVRGTLKDVTEARARATSITIDPSNCTPEQMKAWNQAQGDFAQALGRLMVADENYPELRDLKAFQDVRDKLEGAVNRLREARRKYNEQAKVYNIKVQSFPNNILAGMFGFQPMFYYEAPAGTEEQTTDFSKKKE
jgi:LemA protein